MIVSSVYKQCPSNLLVAVGWTGSGIVVHLQSYVLVTVLVLASLELVVKYLQIKIHSD